jgi:hypothetical protein
LTAHPAAAHKTGTIRELPIFYFLEGIDHKTRDKNIFKCWQLILHQYSLHLSTNTKSGWNKLIERLSHAKEVKDNSLSGHLCNTNPYGLMTRDAFHTIIILLLDTNISQEGYLLKVLKTTRVGVILRHIILQL